MSTKLPIPRALFDTMANINEPVYDCIQNFLATVDVKAVQQEYEYTKQFLKSYTGSQDTFTSYRREVERLLQWCWLIVKKPVIELNRNDIRDYLDFVHKPPQSWIADQNFTRFITSKDGTKAHNISWRPFVVRLTKAQRMNGNLPDKSRYKLSNKSIEALFAGLSTYFTFLQQEEYLDANPVALIHQKSKYIQKSQTTKVTRKLSPTQWSYVIKHAEQQADGNPETERNLFMMSAFYLLGLRISELAETPGRYPKMSDFAPDKHGLWWFSTVSKGNKLRDVAMPDAMLDALKRYRLALGLTALPNRSEDTPIMHKQRGEGGLGPRQIRNLVQQCFDQAEANLRKTNQLDEAEDLRAATVHWLRHTAITADVEFRPREHVRDDVGHENPATTERYIDADRMARHQSAKGKKLTPEAAK